MGSSFFLKRLALFLVSVVVLYPATSPKSYAADSGKIFNLFYKDIKTISIRDGDTGRTIYLEDEKDIQKAVDCLNAFHYDDKLPNVNAVGYQYMLQIEFKEKSIKGAPSFYQFTANSISVDGEKLIGDELSFSKLIDFLPEKADYLFDDVSSDDRCYNDIKYVIQNGIFYGTSHSHFEPNTPLSRGMAVTIIHRLAGCPNPQKKMVFRDVETGNWYTEAVYWATEARIVSGVGNDTFLPTDLVTREQLAAMMYRYVQHEWNVSAKGDLSKYTDGADVSPWAKEAIEWAIRSGIINCKIDIVSQMDSVIDPQGEVSRADVAGMMRRLNEYIAKVQMAI